MTMKYNFVSVRKEHRGYCRMGEFEIKIRKKGISFGTAFFKILNKDFVEVLQDKEKNVIAFKGTDNSEIGYTLMRGKKVVFTCLPSRWMAPKELKGIFTGKIENGFIILNLGEYK